jgi:hypothetical protein
MRFMVGGAFISFSSALTWIKGTGYVVCPRGGVNGGHANLLASIGCWCVAAWSGQGSTPTVIDGATIA